MEIRKLNTLRGLAALIVFFSHFSDQTGWLNGALGGGAGQYGVMLFFLLSGFLMAYLYMDRTFNSGQVRRYVLARAGRVLPLFLLVVFASFFAQSFGYNHLYDMADWHAVASHLLFLSGESVLWTIPVEVHFYLLFLLFWYLAGRNLSGWIYVVVVAIMLLLFFSNFPRWHGELWGLDYNLFRTLRSLPFFFVGMILGMQYKTWVIPDDLKKHGFVLALLLIPLMFPYFSPITTDDKTKMWLSYEVLMVMAVVFFCLVYLVPDNNRLLANKAGDFLGRISYSVYLLHLPIIQWVDDFQQHTTWKLVIALGLTLFLAHFTFLLFEKPVAKWIRKTKAVSC